MGLAPGNMMSEMLGVLDGVPKWSVWEERALQLCLAGEGSLVGPVVGGIGGEDTDIGEGGRVGGGGEIGDVAGGVEGEDGGAAAGGLFVGRQGDEFVAEGIGHHLQEGGRAEDSAAVGGDRMA